jgi:hypothetical protein
MTALVVLCVLPGSLQVRAVTEHKFTPDRLMYQEGMKLVQRLEQEEAALRSELAVRNAPRACVPGHVNTLACMHILMLTLVLVVQGACVCVCV